MTSRCISDSGFTATALAFIGDSWLRCFSSGDSLVMTSRCISDSGFTATAPAFTGDSWPVGSGDSLVMSSRCIRVHGPRQSMGRSVINNIFQPRTRRHLNGLRKGGVHVRKLNFLSRKLVGSFLRVTNFVGATYSIYTTVITYSILRVYLYCPPGSQETGVAFNIVGQVMGLLLEHEYVSVSKLSETQKADGHHLVISAFDHWEEVVLFEDEASLIAASSNFTNVLHTSSSPRAEDLDGSKFLASQKIGGFDYAQPSASSPDIISSIYSVGSTSGLDDYALHNIDGFGLRYDQPLSFPGQVTNSLIFDTDPMAHALFVEDHLQFSDADLQSQNMSSEPHGSCFIC